MQFQMQPNLMTNAKARFDLPQIPIFLLPGELADWILEIGKPLHFLEPYFRHLEQEIHITLHQKCTFTTNDFDPDRPENPTDTQRFFASASLYPCKEACTRTNPSIAAYTTSKRSSSCTAWCTMQYGALPGNLTLIYWYKNLGSHVVLDSVLLG